MLLLNEKNRRSTYWKLSTAQGFLRIAIKYVCVIFLKGKNILGGMVTKIFIIDRGIFQLVCKMFNQHFWSCGKNRTKKNGLIIHLKGAPILVNYMTKH